MKNFQKIISGIGIITIVALTILAFTGMSIGINLFLGIFCILWGVDNILSWHIGDKIGISLGISIPENASETLRFLGLCCAIFWASFGVLALAGKLPL